jgi:hypothetical protein
MLRRKDEFVLMSRERIQYAGSPDASSEIVFIDNRRIGSLPGIPKKKGWKNQD